MEHGWDPIPESKSFHRNRRYNRPRRYRRRVCPSRCRRGTPIGLPGTEVHQCSRWVSICVPALCGRSSSRLLSSHRSASQCQRPNQPGNEWLANPKEIVTIINYNDNPNTNEIITVIMMIKSNC